MLKNTLKNVRKKAPLIHNITNYVTANDVANILLSCGASPIMADSPDEVEEITAMASGLNLNLGTLRKETVTSMLTAGKKANSLCHPIVLDPVGVGSSTFRTQTAFTLLHDLNFSVIRGNISEIKALALKRGYPTGVDANISDLMTVSNIDETISLVQKFAYTTNAIIVVTGAVDIVANAKIAYCIKNGHPMMSHITGSGCQLSALITAFCAANKTSMIEACVGAVCSMGICGEIAFQRMSKLDGNSSYRNYLIDAMYNLQPDMLERNANYEMR